MIRLALIQDLGSIMDIVSTSIAAMREAGNDQWSATYPARVDFMQDIERGELYIDDDAGPRAMVCLNHEEPSEYASLPWAGKGPATVIHRLAVHPEYRGKGIAAGLFGLAEYMALKNGTGYLRSDTYSRNPAMNGLFAKLGYRRVGELSFPGRLHHFYAYEKFIETFRG